MKCCWVHTWEGSFTTRASLLLWAIIGVIIEVSLGSYMAMGNRRDYHIHCWGWWVGSFTTRASLLLWAIIGVIIAHIVRVCPIMYSALSLFCLSPYGQMLVASYWTILILPYMLLGRKIQIARRIWDLELFIKTQDTLVVKIGRLKKNTVIY